MNVAAKSESDVLIVGAGPAGLFAALGISATSNRHVTVIDQGSSITDRRQERAQGHRSNLVQGVGGAGLFSDGKLCLSLDVGGQLESALSKSRKDTLIGSVESVFVELLGRSRVRRSGNRDVATASGVASAVGLHFKYYPVLHIGTDQCADVIVRLCSLLERRGVRILDRTRLTDIDSHSKGGLIARIVSRKADATLMSNCIVLAMGKVGAALQSDLCRRAGARVTSRPVYVGVRLETDAAALEPLFRLAKDPKYSLRLGDGSKIKTHCASDGGEMLDLRYDGLPLAGAHNFSSPRTGRSGFAILWDGMRSVSDSYGMAKRLMGQIAVHTDGRLLAQRLHDYRAGRATTPQALAGVSLSYPDCAAGDVRHFLPPEYFVAFDTFVERLARLAPGLLGRNTVLVAPAIEWWMKTVQVEPGSMETGVPGLYVCGDGSGWSQGIVHSAATGLLAAEGITGRAFSGLGEDVNGIAVGGGRVAEAP
jgi:uncharacterized FAD-dependent dehydrogenase